MGKSNEYNEKQWTFEDGVRTIDYVLVWNENSAEATSLEAVENRAIFEENLREEGLELEQDYVEKGGLYFVKIHTPLEVLQRYAEILKLRMPMKDLQDTLEMQYQELNAGKSSFKRCPCCKCFDIKPNVFPEYDQKLTTTYTRAREYLFDAEDPGFFTPAQKSRIVQFILERTFYSNDIRSDVLEFGIRRLIMHGAYEAAYPLHDGDIQTPGCMRYRFYHYWAKFKNWYKTQPVDQLRQYFGVKTALYFVWLGYYTRMLIPASIVGVACFIGSLYILPFAQMVDELCDGEIQDPMCPVCDQCNFWNITNYCIQTKVLYVYDNGITVVFAIFISFWAATFLECWKRYSAEITFRWDLTSLDERDENPRPEYAAKLARLAARENAPTRVNLITNATEPKLTFWKHMFPGKALSLTTILLLVSLAVAAVIGVTLYRMFAEHARFGAFCPFGAFSSVTATFLNLLCILILSPIYGKLSIFLTELELPRTQREFDNSLTVKLYLLEFINHYSSIFYIAFFKGKLVGPPNRRNRIFGLRQLECARGNCMLELTQQLAVIMIGKRAYKSIIQIVRPLLRLTLKRRFTKGYQEDTGDEYLSQWQKDYLLEPAGPRMLFPDYLDMVLQYGFVTIFVSAFPLAPIFALVNNIFEIRIDAQKILIYHRRPTMRRNKDIGVWFNILNYISNLAVFTNGFIIAFTSNFVPRIVYRLTKSPNFGTAGFLNHSLSYMAVQDLEMEVMPNSSDKYCRYFDYREPPWSEHKYEETKFYWTVLAGRLLFFIVFENVVILAVVLLKWLIPDVPQTVRWQMRRRHYLINETIINYESSMQKPKIKKKKRKHTTRKSNERTLSKVQFEEA